MLRKTVYFRTQEDLDKFNALSNKAEWLHEQLNQPITMSIDEFNGQSGLGFDITGVNKVTVVPLEPYLTDAEDAA